MVLGVTSDKTFNFIINQGNSGDLRNILENEVWPTLKVMSFNIVLISGGSSAWLFVFRGNNSYGNIFGVDSWGSTTFKRLATVQLGTFVWD